MPAVAALVWGHIMSWAASGWQRGICHRGNWFWGSIHAGSMAGFFASYIVSLSVLVNGWFGTVCLVVSPLLCALQFMSFSCHVPGRMCC